MLIFIFAVTRVESQGHITISLTVTMKDFTKLGYDCGHTPQQRMTLFSSTLAGEDNSASTGETDKGNSRSRRSHKRDEISTRNIDEQDGGIHPSTNRGIFSSRANSNSRQAYPDNRGVVTVGGGNVIVDNERPSTSGINHSENKPIKQSKKKNSPKKANDFDEDTEESSYESSGNNISEKLSDKQEAREKYIEDMTPKKSILSPKSQFAKSPNKFQMFQVDEKTKSNGDRRMEENRHHRRSTNGKRSGEPGASFSRDSGVTFLAGERPDEVMQNSKGQSPKTSTSSSMFAVSDSRRSSHQGSSTDIVELPTTDGSKPRKKSGGVSPFSDASSDGMKSDAVLEAPLAAPRSLHKKTALKPIAGRKPLPSIKK